MNDIRNLLKIAARRIELNRFLNKLHGVALVIAVIALLLMIADRAAASAFVPWLWVGPALAMMALAMALFLWSRNRPSEAHVALAVDERLDLREKLSTALHVQGRDDAFAQAAVEDAVHTARDGRTRERVGRTFTLNPPRGWWSSPLIVLAAIMISFLNPLNLFARDQAANDPAIEQAKLDAEQSIQAVVRAIEQKPELSKHLGEALTDLSNDGTDPNAPRMPEEFKREALKKVTDLNRKLDDIIKGEKGKTNEALERALGQLATPEDGEAKELAEALAKGDFTGAQEALKQMMDKLAKGDLNEEQKQQLAQQLQNIAQQLQQLAQQQEQLENALKQAGMNPALAQNPQALQQAIQNNQNLNEQQKQQLQQLAQAQQAACKMCQGLGQACQQMAQACQGGQQGDGQMGQAGQQMAGQLGNMEALQQLLKEAQAAAGACQGQCQGLGQGLNMQAAMQQWLAQCQGQGGAMGQRGQGAGGKAPIAPTPTGTKAQKANIHTVEGDIIAKMLFEGPQIRGESKAKLVQVVSEARKGFDEGLTEDAMHVKYRDAQMHYFGELEKLTKQMQEQKADEKKPADEKPAEEKKQ